jgi:hypothetical protein
MPAETADPIVQIVDGEKEHVRPLVGHGRSGNHRDTETQREQE